MPRSRNDATSIRPSRPAAVGAMNRMHRVARAAPLTSVFLGALLALAAIGFSGLAPAQATTWVYFAVTVPAYLLFVTTGFAPGPWWPPLMTLLLCAIIDGLIASGSKRRLL